ncbi:hypothetical protein GCM10022243_34400 [Saccharothrix violaceirubra]|uniref:Uncharacterized protein n=1 Tax=Saccharothrix violaceirubra TaxID=413306 RepID=A0A7W7T575_9PSEU|nr:hypothetical protein [Saccharothrix violaceirubra]MBB4966491.1 hypothetical protein [Saccharothrix violaceirubra]
MPLLPAVVPTATGKRSDRVPARLARNVAPLFGIASPTNPFAPTTWLCDFNLITISEIARGAPLPTRVQARRLREAPPGDADWVLDERAVFGAALPNEIVSATTNRYGPDTKSAMLLTATNVLLDPVASAIEQVVPLLRAADGGELPLRLRIVAWATLAVEAFRSQPALLIAAFKARAIQRQSLDSPVLAFSSAVRSRPPARCEIGADTATADDRVTHPRDLHVFDRTVDCLRLPETAPAPEDATVDPEPDHERSGAIDLGDEMVDHLVKLLLDASHPAGVGYVWAGEDEPGQAVAEAMLPSAGIVSDLLDHWFSLHVDGRDRENRPVPVALPDPDGLAPLAGTALVLAALGVARSLRKDVGVPGFTARDFLDLVEGIGALADRCLGDDDPLRAVVDGRLAVLRIVVLKTDRTNPVDGHCATAIAAAGRAVELGRAGLLDRGVVADLLGAVCVELNSLRTINATDPASGLPAPAELAELTRRFWHAYGDALDVDVTALDAEHDQSVAFHLHNYASFLGSLPERGDQRRAAALYRDHVVPARKRLYRRLGHFGPLGASYYVATATTCRLAAWERAHGSHAEAVRWAELGYQWITRVLEHSHYAGMVDRSDESAAQFALRAAPALLFAVELGVTPAAKEVDRVRRLLDVLDRWSDRVTGGVAANSSRYAEIASIRSRIDAISG